METKKRSDFPKNTEDYISETWTVDLINGTVSKMEKVPYMRKGLESQRAYFINKLDLL